MNYMPFCSTEINFIGKEEMIQRLLSLDIYNIMLVMSESSAQRWDMISFINKLKQKCEDLNGTLTWINKVSVNPTQEDIIESLYQIGDKKADIIVAFGGGSSIDLAKGISAFYNPNRIKNYSEEEITNIIINKDYKNKSEFIDIIAVPSTAGTGSEVTQWATIWDVNKTGKLSIDDSMLKPKVAIIVPELTLSMPKNMTLSTGLDALSHAIESYWSRHTTPVVQDIAYRSVELIVKNLIKVINSPDDICLREKLCKASVLAGLAFSQTRTTACHSISYPLTMYFGIPHGLAVSITLDAVSKINKGYFKNDIELFSLFNKYGDIKNWIEAVSEDIINMRLSTFGVKEKDIPMLVDNAFTGGRMDNNPVDLKKNDVSEILMSVL